MTRRLPARKGAVLAALWVLVGCTPQGDPGVSPGGFFDDFEREKLGDDYNVTGGGWSIRDGELRIKGARNRPLWLKRTLPQNVRVEFDVRSESEAGDIKVELFGDGVSKAESTSYTATSYVVIFGGWNNSKNVLARLDEHGDDRVVGSPYKVVQGRRYHMKIERRGATITAWVDDHELVRMVDPDPLGGPGHDHFAFNDWESELWFDNLRIEPL
ncbi:MAG: DUF1080 domain-containing protein [Myxococcales bacterium]